MNTKPGTIIHSAMTHDELAASIQPEWVHFLEMFLNSISGDSELFHAGCPFIKTDHPLPFEELFIPLLNDPKMSRSFICEDLEHLVSDDAFTDLQRGLLYRLVHIISPRLHEGFDVFRLLWSPESLMSGKSSESREAYRGYLEHLKKGGLRELLLKYPVLSRIIGIYISDWHFFAGELIRRFSNDASMIQSRFFQNEIPGRITNIEFFLSDPHCKGRTVSIITFESGSKVVYKPKNQKVEECWFHLIQWLKVNGAPDTGIAPEVLDKGDYGWAEFIEYLPCKCVDEVRGYYYRSGSLLFLLTIFQATDIHMENIIAHGDAPALIDTETLMHPWLTNRIKKSLKQDNALSLGRRLLRESTLSTGYLPAWSSSGEFESRNVGGLLPQDEQIFATDSYIHVNTDAMKKGPARYESKKTRHLPVCNGNEYSVIAYRDTLKQGFRDMYEYFMRVSANLLEPQGPVTCFKNSEVRYVARQTLLYMMLLNRSFSKGNLHDLDAWMRSFDFLTKAGNLSDSDTDNADIAESEKRTLNLLNIPRFHAEAGGRDLILPDGSKLKDFFSTSSYDQVIERIKTLDVFPLELNIKLIDHAFENLFGNHVNHSHEPIRCRMADFIPEYSEQPDQPDQQDQPSQSRQSRQSRQPHQLRQSLLKHTLKLGEILCSAAVIHNGTAAWIGNTPLGESSRFNIDALAYDLYGGSPGTALFLASLYHKTGEDKYRDIALQGIMPLFQQLDQGDPEFIRKFGIGGGTGLGSSIYALMKISDFLCDSQCLSYARKAADLLCSLLDNDKDPATEKPAAEKPAADDLAVDVIKGLAGALLGIISLHEREGDPKHKDAAIRIAKMIIERQIAHGDFRGGWMHQRHQPHIGFAHGATGIAYSLSRVFRIWPDKILLQSVKSAVEYENRYFSVAHGNWPDFKAMTRFGGEPQFPNQWCYGAAGIGIGRIGILDSIEWDDHTLSRDIERACCLMEKLDLNRLDTLCCGLSAILELCILMENYGPGQKIPIQVSKVRDKVAGHMINRHTEHGFFQCGGGRDEMNPSLFTGVAGIGYQFLRFLDPAEYPSLLLWR